MNIRTLRIEITGLHCASCGILVDDCLEELDGVVSSQTHLRSGRCGTVVAVPVTDTEILAAVAEARYTGRIVQAVVAS